MSKVAFVTGITGQDGSYLAEFLLHKGYDVHGLIRRASTFNTHRIDHIYVDPHETQTNGHFYLHYGDLSDARRLSELLSDIQPDEVYNLAAQSHVRVSFDMPDYTGDIVGLGTVRLLEAVKGLKKDVRFYQASSSEMFGSENPPQNENSPFKPQSPYACAKLYAHWIVKNYRAGFNMFASNGILFNHESPRRGETFVTRKISRAVAAMYAGKQSVLYLGNLDAKRDWGYAPEYVEYMWKILQHEKPDDFVIGTGESHTVREFVETAFAYAGIRIEWKGSGVQEIGVVSEVTDECESIKAGDEIIKIDPRYFRPTEVDFLLSDASKAKEAIGWDPKIGFKDLVKIMVDFDMERCGLDAPAEGLELSLAKGFGWTNHSMYSMG